ncbi:hypothetical protein BDN72DRAFT_582065 [Pluteus cervinus]|uniref:Uncharacterized protein n=1 Tax=Pluteus cervinus TaxID=181527 RepID=A0ACD3AW95_9AGAR|nr:hypothetical protein BDN72DRAFT_582065 [Pluteus cervinus]
MILAVISYQLGTRRALDPEQWERIRQEWEQKRDQWMGREADIARREGAMKRKEDEWQSKQEEERTIRDSFRWANLTPSTQCTRYGVREYTATFFPGYSWLSHSEKLTSCSNTEAVVMGHNYPKPDYCQFQNNQYIGHWSVGDLPDCKTYFEWFKDRGCVAPGSPLRRYEAHLGTQRPEDDGQIMCDTTPALLKGKSFDKPDSCAHWSEGWWGIFFIEDAGCQNLQVQS